MSPPSTSNYLTCGSAVASPRCVSCFLHKEAAQSFQKRIFSIDLSNPEGKSDSTLINTNEGNKELSVGEVVTQERSKVDEITDVMMTRKDELELRHELPDHSGISEEEIPVKGICFDLLPLAATRANRIIAMRCRARMYVMLDREKKSLMVSRLELRHSHPCSAKKVVHYHEYRELTMHAKCVITDNDVAGIRPNKTYLALANKVGGSSNLSFSVKNVRNYITRILRCADDNVDFKEMMNYFVRIKEINPNFYAIVVDSANKFRSALWVDARCRTSYEYYEDVVSFDTTYRRNRHGLPFASFVGVNHHGKSILLGCALLGSEEIPSFEWVFTQWVRCVGTVPKGIITDQCKALADAIRKVLPDTVHRWYIWHIMKKSQFKLRGYARYEELNAKMNHIVYNSPSADSFEVDWAKFIKEFDLVDEQKVFWENVVYHTFIVEFDPLSQKVRCKCNKFEFSVYCVATPLLCGHTTELTQRLCSEFYNVAQEFVGCDEKAAILRSAIWDAKSKQTDYHASMHSSTSAATQNTMPTQSIGGVKS
ncbi:hypothetical protein Ahy_B06g083803 [Arachis hypogaea]|uniref:MULE transposase domain-containing protein n=1 Tax=Arachis hypogaea TaxID=3818 RepID=A0A444YQP8_ARAHY|nr:hypothetical protein Ahy_B06g083803 [Arachis hypogaea]